MWIRLQTSDTTNLPKAGGLCNLYNDRYVLMSGGCWVENGQDCIQYGWNPLLYDIGIAAWAADWTFEPKIDGYVVPEQIYSIIGGST